MNLNFIILKCIKVYLLYMSQCYLVKLSFLVSLIPLYPPNTPILQVLLFAKCSNSIPWHGVFFQLVSFFYYRKSVKSEIYPLNKLLSIKYSIINNRHNAVHEISRVIPSAYLKLNNSPSLPHSPWQLPFCSLLLWSWLF